MAESDVGDFIRKPRQGQQVSSRRRIPNLDCFVAAAGGQGFSVGTEGNLGYRIHMTLGIPNANGLVPAGAGNVLPIRTERYSFHRVRVASETQQLSPRHGIPHLDESVG